MNVDQVGAMAKQLRTDCLKFPRPAQALSGTDAGFWTYFFRIDDWRVHVKIRAGYDIAFQCFHDTPMALMLSIEPARVGDLLSQHGIQFSPNIASRDYVDMFGNTCTRILAPAGLIEICNDFLIADSGLPDVCARRAAARNQRFTG